MKGPRRNLAWEPYRQLQGQIPARDKCAGTASGWGPSQAPGHSLFTGAQGRPVLHLVQLVHFVLLRREPSKTRDVGRPETHRLMQT